MRHQHLAAQPAASLRLRCCRTGRTSQRRRVAAALPPPAAASSSGGLSGLDIRTLTPQQLQLHQAPQQEAPSAASLLDVPPLPEWGCDAFLMAGCEAAAAPLRVAVLVSGGVDSSLALQLVAAAGHTPTAFYLQIWFQEDFRNFWDACPWEEDLQYARKVCDALGVPLVVVPLTQQYWERVVSHSVAEVKAGRTPNPDMLCNSRVKFGAFVEYLEREHAGSFDRVASGHYAMLQRPPPTLAGGGVAATAAAVAQQQHHEQQQQQHHHHHHEQQQQLADRHLSHSSASSSSGEVLLCCCPDAVKDQTYFLAGLSPAQLARCMFPLGGFTKAQVRVLAAAAGLATSGRKDSQGICFLGKVKFGEFVKEHLGEWPGPLVEEDSGQVVGLHDGYWFYTVGQRGGIKLPGGPWYVTAKDMARNVVYVSRAYYEQHRRRDAFVCGPLNWLGSARPVPDVPLLVKVRHGPNTYACQLQLGLRAATLAQLQPAPAGAGMPPLGNAQQQQQQADTDSAGPEYGLVTLSSNDQGLAAGQYAVFYQGGVCLGSAQMLGAVAHTVTPCNA